MIFIFDLFINIFQSAYVSYLLLKCLGKKKETMDSFVVYIVGVTLTFIYLEILNNITAFEGVGVYFYLILSIVYSICLLSGRLFDKIFYNIVIVTILAFSALISAGIYSLTKGIGYISLVTNDTTERMVATLLAQVILVILGTYVIKLTKSISEIKDYKYMLAATAIPILSVIACCLILYRDNNNAENMVVYSYFAVIVIIFINVMNFVQLIFEHKVYEEKINTGILLNAYRQQEENLKEIKGLKNEIDQTRHEVKRVMNIVGNFIEEKDYGKAKEFLAEFTSDKSLDKVDMIQSDNLVLNYLVNRKIAECQDKNIIINCFISGEICGIKDVDMYILLGNLLDNAIEAAQKTKDRKINLSACGEEDSIVLEIYNSTGENVLEDNPGFKTTKTKKEGHGFGIKNIENVVHKYDGAIKYFNKGKDGIGCRLILVKDKTL